MKERPILFSAPMVRAILDGSKTQTRRVVKPQPPIGAPVSIDPWEHGITAFNPGEFGVYREGKPFGMWGLEYVLKCPYCQPGDRLWVRETFGLHSYGDETNWLSESGTAITKDTLVLWDMAYRADWCPCQEGCHWRPSIHMPRWASRILLEVTDVRVEQLNDINEEDAKAEGAEPYLLPVNPAREGLRHVDGFAQIWESINGIGSWKANPWVWVIEFKRIDNA